MTGSQRRQARSQVCSRKARQTRCTQKLPDSESFIVSLTLGLAQLVSRNVHMGSLFLDDGFCMLDEQALATPQQGGKHMGIIPYVAALKERSASPRR